MRQQGQAGTVLSAGCQGELIEVISRQKLINIVNFVPLMGGREVRELAVKLTQGIKAYLWF